MENSLGRAMDSDFYAKGFGPHLVLEGRARSCQSNEVSLHLRGVWVPTCCCYLVAKSCPTLSNPMDYSMPGFPVLHCLLEFALIHVH